MGGKVETSSKKPANKIFCYRDQILAFVIVINWQMSA